MTADTRIELLFVDGERLRRNIEALAAIGRAPSGGLMRRTFSPAFEEARAWLMARMREAGLGVGNDAVGNVIGRMGPAGPAVLAGSHIDAVPDGGPLDGALGVLAAVEAAHVMHESALPLGRAFEAVALADEESGFSSFLGSRGMTGDIGVDEVLAARGKSGDSLAEAMQAAGFDPRAVASAARPVADLAAYVELHIEQGMVLERGNVAIGIVEAIVGLAHADFRFLGEANHAGTTPMDSRRDAFMGAAAFAIECLEMVRAEGSPQTRLTFGIIEAKPQVFNIIPAEVRLCQELRDPSDGVLDRLIARSRDLAERVATRHNLEVVCDELDQQASAAMSPSICGHIAGAAESLGLDTLDMASGAGHDAQVMAGVCDTGMIFIPSQGGRSHCPQEWSDWQDIENGANVLLRTVARLVAG